MNKNFRYGEETIIRKLSSDYSIPDVETHQQTQPPNNQQDDNLKYNLLDPTTGVFDKWRLFKTHNFVHVAKNATRLNEERNVCLAAQTSLDRLYSLTETLEKWSGPVSIGKIDTLIDIYLKNDFYVVCMIIN